MKKARFIALLLALLMAAASCGGEAPAADTASGTADDTTTAAETADPLADNLPDKDYGGYTYRILGADVDIPMVLAEEQTGSLVNDSVYTANVAVEERFNVDIVQVKLDKWNNAAAIRTTILSGSDDCDLGVCHDYTAGNLSLEGLFLDLRSMEHLDFSKPWWPAFTCDGLTVNGKMYIFSNFIGYNGLRGTKNMYVNLDKLKEYKLASPYDMVRGGTWTLDNVIGLTKSIYEDVNGDGTADRDDFYGFAFTGLFYGWLENFGIEAYTHNDARTAMELAINTPYTVELIDTVKGWLYGGNEGVYYKKSHTGLNNPDAYPSIFADGNCLFTYGSLYVLIDNLTDSAVNYGILPMPKFDEHQADYYGVCYDSPMFVPISVTDVDRTAVILEAMSAEGYKHILPAYKDITLKGRYATATDDAEMLDIIFTNRVLSFSYIYGNGGIQNVLNTIVPSDTQEFASYYASMESAEQERLKLINEFFAK